MLFQGHTPNEPKVADQHQDIFPTFAFYILQTVLAYFEK